MAPTSLRSVVFLVLAVAVVVSDAQLQLSESFYDATCPQAASIVQQKVNAFVDADRGLAAALMRLHFHDCFVRVRQLVMLKAMHAYVYLLKCKTGRQVQF